MKKMISLFVLVLMSFSTTLFSAEVIVGGFLPLINNVAPMPVTSLDFSQTQTEQIICKVLINNNEATGWGLATTFDANSPDFVSEGGSTITGLNYKWDATAANIAIFDGADASDWATVMAAPAIDPTSAGEIVLQCDNGTLPTRNLICDIMCDWTDPVSYTGFYQKTITLIMSAHP